jgi:hypothetical protein
MLNARRNAFDGWRVARPTSSGTLSEPRITRDKLDSHKSWLMLAGVIARSGFIAIMPSRVPSQRTTTLTCGTSPPSIESSAWSRKNRQIRTIASARRFACERVSASLGLSIAALSAVSMTVPSKSSRLPPSAHRFPTRE